MLLLSEPENLNRSIMIAGRLGADLHLHGRPRPPFRAVGSRKDVGEWGRQTVVSKACSARFLLASLNTASGFVLDSFLNRFGDWRQRGQL